MECCESIALDRSNFRFYVGGAKADPGDGTVHPDLAYVLARGFTAMGWSNPQAAAEDLIDVAYAQLTGKMK